MVPFSNVGVDFAGPLFIKEGKKTSSVYTTLYTCCVTRAVHLDIVQNLFTKAFMKCLRRFISRAARPCLIISDNAKTFKAAAKLIKDMHEDDEVKGHLADNRIEWQLNLEKFPWWGGFSERMIGTMKRRTPREFSRN